MIRSQHKGRPGLCFQSVSVGRRLSLMPVSTAFRWSWAQIFCLTQDPQQQGPTHVVTQTGENGGAQGGAGRAELPFSAQAERPSW